MVLFNKTHITFNNIYNLREANSNFLIKLENLVIRLLSAIFSFWFADFIVFNFIKINIFSFCPGLSERKKGFL